jgi:YegS/Rv2252/BmrU family lipid kinase
LKNATIIYNPISGGRPAARANQIREALAALEDQGIAATAMPTTAPGSAANQARAVAQSGQLVVVCGGDGTINEVINGLVPGDATLAVLPAGTANIFAKEVGLPRNPVRAAKELGSWQAKRIAVGLAAGCKKGGGKVSRYFLCVAGMGFDAQVVHDLDPDSKEAWGVAAYVAEGLRQAFRYAFPPFNCRLNGREISATFATVQRTERYAGWLHMAPGASLEVPEFQLCAFKSRHRLKYFLYSPALILRQHLRFRSVERIKTEKVDCSLDKSEDTIFFQVDGELAGLLPATFEIVPDALTILVPDRKTSRRR